jgi:putative addiction module antidote
MTTVKLIVIGDEVGVILPSRVLQRLGVTAGDWIRLDETQDGLYLTRCDSAFAVQMESAERVTIEDQSALRRLKD